MLTVSLTIDYVTGLSLCNQALIDLQETLYRETVLTITYSLHCILHCRPDKSVPEHTHVVYDLLDQINRIRKEANEKLEKAAS